MRDTASGGDIESRRDLRAGTPSALSRISRVRSTNPAGADADDGLPIVTSNSVRSLALSLIIPGRLMMSEHTLRRIDLISEAVH